MALGPAAVRRGTDVMARIDLIRVSDRILADAATIMPANLRSLDAIHLATALSAPDDLAGIVTYDERLARAAATARLQVFQPK